MLFLQLVWRHWRTVGSKQLMSIHFQIHKVKLFCWPQSRFYVYSSSSTWRLLGRVYCMCTCIQVMDFTDVNVFINFPQLICTVRFSVLFYSLRILLLKFQGSTVSYILWITIFPFQFMVHCTGKGHNMNAQILVFILVLSFN